MNSQTSGQNVDILPDETEVVTKPDEVRWENVSSSHFSVILIKPKLHETDLLCIHNSIHNGTTTLQQISNFPVCQDVVDLRWTFQEFTPNWQMVAEHVETSDLLLKWQDRPRLRG